MIRYKDNPSLKLKTVKTVKGAIEYRRNCRKIRDKFYIINEDCFEIDGRWYLYNSKLIAFDYEKGIHVVIKNHPLVYGIVGFKSDNTPIFGYFTENKYNNLIVNISGYGGVQAFSEKTLLDGGYIENISDGIWYHKKSMSSDFLARTNRIDSRRVHTNKGYNIEDNEEEFKQKIEAFDKYPVKIPLRAAQFAKFLGNVTWGCEIETSKGYIPEHIQNRTGVIICRDGSIDNAEFVTVPMKGAKGLVNMKYLSSELARRTLADIKCSFHIHLGTIPTDRLFILALYALGIRIQDELFTMFPYYKTKWEGIKKQDYNQKLKRLGIEILKPNSTKEEFTKYVDEGYYRIFTWLNDGLNPDDQFNRVANRHHQTAKWNRKSRYFWLNFMNLFFSPRRTAEFRLHQATLNGQKMVNWLFICVAIIRYAEKYAKEILTTDKNITLDDVLDYYAKSFTTKEAKFLSEYLKAYVKDRKEYFRKDFERGDFVSQKEQSQDKDYVFTHEGVSWLY